MVEPSSNAKLTLRGTPPTSKNDDEYRTLSASATHTAKQFVVLLCMYVHIISPMKSGRNIQQVNDAYDKWITYLST